MIIKKGVVIVFAFLFLFSLVSAFNVQTDPVRGTIINDNNVPGVIHFKITSTNESGNYEIYTTERFQITPREFTILNKQTVEIDVNFLPTDAMRKNTGYVSYDNVHLKVSGAFFDSFEKDISLSPYEIEKFSVSLNQDQLKKLVFGEYSIKSEVTFNGQTEDINVKVKLLEKSGIDATQYTEGIIIRKLNVERKNEGNVPTISEIQIKKNIISRLFTTFSIEPQRIERKGVSVYYYWQKELQPDESLKVKATTNLLFPFLLIIAIVIIGYLSNLYFSTNLNVRKQVQFVKTHGGEFALKVTLRVSSKKFMDNVTLYDRLPAMAHLYEKYGQTPSKVEHGRLTWNIGKLGQGEERIFSYIIYSKLKVIGKFELPRATAVYNVNSKIHESISNKVLFIHEPSLTQN